VVLRTLSDWGRLLMPVCDGCGTDSLRTGSARRRCKAVPACPYRQRLRGRDPRLYSTGGCSNGSTKAINLLVKKVKRVGHGFRKPRQLPVRLLLHCGVAWQTHRTARLRDRSPRFVA
jgi:hypothetical protein